MSESRRQWSLDELQVLAGVYFSADFAAGDDQRVECRTMADCFGRSPSAVDRQWRNLDAVVQGKDEGLNIGKRVKSTARDYLQDPSLHKRVALEICRSRNWPLSDLIVHGKFRPANRPVLKAVDRGIHPLLEDFCAGLRFCVFPSGAQGFARRDPIVYQGVHYTAYVSAVIEDSRHQPDLDVKTTVQEISNAVVTVIAGVRPTSFPTGRVGYWGSGQVRLSGHKYRIGIQVVERGRT